MKFWIFILTLSSFFILQVTPVSALSPIPGQVTPIKLPSNYFKVQFQENLILLDPPMDRPASCWRIGYQNDKGEEKCYTTTSAGPCSDVNGHTQSCWSTPGIYSSDLTGCGDPASIKKVKVAVLPIIGRDQEGSREKVCNTTITGFTCVGENNCTWNVDIKDKDTGQVLIQSGFPTVFRFDENTQTAHVLTRSEWNAIEGKFGILNIYGQCGPGKIDTALGCIPVNNTDDFIGWILSWAIGVGGGIAFLLMLSAGFKIMTASGNPERLQSGRELLTAAISGLILIVFSVFLLRLIGVDILKLPGF